MNWVKTSRTNSSGYAINLCAMHGYLSTVCPRSSDPFYTVSYYIEWVTTFWTFSKGLNGRQILHMQYYKEDFVNNIEIRIKFAGPDVIKYLEKEMYNLFYFKRAELPMYLYKHDATGVIFCGFQKVCCTPFRKVTNRRALL